MEREPEISAIQSLLVIVPAFNEQRSVGAVVNQLRQLGYDVLVVDDCSTDETASVARTLGATVLSLPIRNGVGGALGVGFRFAVDNGYDSVVQVDADGQHPVDEVGNLIAAAVKSGAHLVIGSRYRSGNSTFMTSRMRRIGMRLLSFVSSRSAGVSITDSTSGFRFVREPLLTQFALDFPEHYLGDTFEATVYAARAGFKIEEIPASITVRQFGSSSIGDIKGSLLLVRSLLIVIFRLRKLRIKSPNEALKHSTKSLSPTVAPED